MAQQPLWLRSIGRVERVQSCAIDLSPATGLQSDERGLFGRARRMMDQALAQQAVEEEFDLATISWLQRLLLKRMRMNWWQLGLLAFAIYYVAPGLAAVLDQTALCLGTESFLKPAEGRRLADYYVTDLMHAAFALTGAAVGGGLISLALQRFGDVCRTLIDRGLLTVPDEVVRREIQNMRKTYRHPALQVGIFVIATSATGAVFGATEDPLYKQWWGYRGNGHHGWVVLLVGTWALAYVGALSIVRLTVGLRMLSRLLSHPVRLIPLHSDECNGFAVLGDYLMLLVLCALMVAATVWITVESQYPNVERHLWVLLAEGLVMGAIPVFLLWPFVACTVQIARARAARVKVFDDALEGELRTIEDTIRADAVARWSDALERVARARKAVAEVFPLNPFPFRPRLIGALSVTYVVQAAFFLERVAAILRKA